MKWNDLGQRPQWTVVGLLGHLAGMNKYRGVQLAGCNGLSLFDSTKMFSFLDFTKKLTKTNIDYWNTFGDDVNIPGVRQLAQGYGKFATGVNQTIDKAVSLSPFDGSVTTTDYVYGVRSSFYTAIELSKELKAVKQAGVEVALGAAVGTHGSAGVTNVEAYARARLTLNLDNLKGLVSGAAKGLKDALAKVSKKSNAAADKEKTKSAAERVEQFKNMAGQLFQVLPEFDVQCEAIVFLGVCFDGGKVVPYLRVCTNNAASAKLTIQVNTKLLDKLTLPPQVVQMLPENLRSYETKQTLAEKKGAVENWNATAEFKLQAGLVWRNGKLVLDVNKAVGEANFKPGGRGWQIQLTNVGAHMPQSFL